MPKFVKFFSNFQIHKRDSNIYRKNEVFLSKNSPIATLFTANIKWIRTKMNLAVLGISSAINRLSRG